MNIRFILASLICAIMLDAHAAPPDPSLTSDAGIRPQVTQFLKDAQRLANATHPDSAAIMAKLQAAAGVPDITSAEKNRVVHVAHLILGNRTLADVMPNFSDAQFQDQYQEQP
jgi:hypothetical protein